jgi:hypothetical protein
MKIELEKGGLVMGGEFYAPLRKGVKIQNELGGFERKVNANERATKYFPPISTATDSVRRSL